jgi:hypothetical protein
MGVEWPRMTRASRARICLLVATVLGVGCSTYGSWAPYTSGQSPELPPEFRIPLVTLGALDLPGFQVVGPPLLPLIPIHVRVAGPTELELSFTTDVPPSRDFSMAWRPCFWSDPGQQICAHSAAVSWVVTPFRRPHLLSWSRDFSDSTESNAERLTRAAILERARVSADPPPTSFLLMATYQLRCHDVCPPHLRLDFTELFESEGAPWTSESLEFRREQSGGYLPFFLPWKAHG